MDLLHEPSPGFFDKLRQQLSRGRWVLRKLPGGGRLHIDRQLPFLCVYGAIRNDWTEAGADLVRTQASYLATGRDTPLDIVIELIAYIRNLQKRELGDFAIFELVEHWPEQDQRDKKQVVVIQPAFEIATPAHRSENSVAALESALRDIKIHHRAAKVTAVSDGSPSALFQHYANRFPDEQPKWLTLRLAPIYRSRSGKKQYPMIYSGIEVGLSRALLKSAFAFTNEHTALDPPHHLALGRKARVRAAWNVDRALEKITNSFDFLRCITPVNSHKAWEAFSASNFEKMPRFLYVPLPIDTELAKRKLYDIHIERVEDRTLSRLFREKRAELELQLTMLRNREKRNFYFASLQLYGEVRETLVNAAHELLAALPSDADTPPHEKMSAAAVAEVAERQIAEYRAHFAAFNGSVHVAPDNPPGMSVSQGRLLLCSHTDYNPARVMPLLHHEIGTHMLTWFNGVAQRLHLLCSGLADYECTQEGLAVLAEFLVGGLDPHRLRLLAGRVVACRSLADNATFIDTFRLLTEKHDFAPYTAFSIATRVHRSGGTVKDAVYLRGLQKILEYLAKDGDLQPFWLGKIALHHVAIMREFLWRGFFVPPPLEPLYLQEEIAKENLARCRAGLRVHELVTPHS